MSTENRSRFPLTRWSLVGRAGNGDMAALDELCRAYQEPLLRFLLGAGLAPTEEDAKDILQGFLIELTCGPMLAGADQNRGRLSSLFKMRLRSRSVDALKKAGCIKRGSGAPNVSLDEMGPKPAPIVPDLRPVTPDEQLDRDWDWVTLRRGVAAFEAVFAGNECKAAIARLFLDKLGLLEGPAPARGDVLLTCGITENALNISLTRLQKHFNDAMRATVLETVGDEEDIEEEIRRVLSSFRHQR